MHRSVDDILRLDRSVFGAVCAMPGGFAAELIGHVGFDFVMVDCQHGLLGYDAMVHTLQALSATNAVPLVRVRANDAAAIGATLDAGAAGIIVPAISSRADAQRAVAAACYPPSGVRSMGPVRAAAQLAHGPAMLAAKTPQDLDREVARIMLIEDKDGVDAADEICSCPGVDGVAFGPVDLALSQGLAPANAKEWVDECARTVVAAATRHGKFAMTVAMSGQDAAARVADGFRLLLLGGDHSWLRAGAASALLAARAALKD